MGAILTKLGYSRENFMSRSHNEHRTNTARLRLSEQFLRAVINSGAKAVLCFISLRIIRPYAPNSPVSLERHL